MQEYAEKDPATLLADATQDALGPNPTITVSATSTGFSITSSVAGTLEFVGLATIGTAVVGANTLVEQATVRTGTIRLVTEYKSSSATSQTFSLGTTGNDTIDTSGSGTQVDYVLGGSGVDTITTGGGADWIVGGAGADVINAGAGADTIYAGDGDDSIVADQNDPVIYGGDGTDTLKVQANFDDQFTSQLSSIEVVNLEADGLTFALSTLNFITATINGFATGSSTIVGSNGDETINGGTGDDNLTGGVGDDILDGKDGDDNYNSSSGDDTFKVTGGTGNTIGSVSNGDIIQVSAGAAVDISTTTSFTATSNTWNLGGAAANFDITENQGSKTLDFSSATVTTASTDGFKISSSGLNGSTLRGSSGYDTITSTHQFGTATLIGNAGNDTITGSNSAADIIDGGAGVDTINARNGADTITIGNGQDVITLTETTAAADTVIYSTTFAAGNTNAASITGFANGTGADKFDIGFALGHGTLTYAAGTGATNTISADPVVTVANNGTVAANTGVVFLLSGSGDQMATSTLANAVANAVTAMTSTADFAASNIATGDSMVVVLDDGTDSFIFHYVADGTAATTSAADLELIAIIKGVADAGSFANGDFIQPNLTIQHKYLQSQLLTGLAFLCLGVL